MPEGLEARLMRRAADALAEQVVRIFSEPGIAAAPDAPVAREVAMTSVVDLYRVADLVDSELGERTRREAWLERQRAAPASRADDEEKGE